MESVIEGEIF